MKFKKVKVLCMITAIGVVSATAAISGDSTKNAEIASSPMETEALEEKVTEAEKDVSVARMLLPEVASANDVDETEISTEDMTASAHETDTENAADETEEKNAPDLESDAAEDMAGNEDSVDEDTKDKNADSDTIEETLIIADVNSYVNIRSMPGMEGEILGKLYDDSVGEMLGEENGWYYIQSGTVTGYVKAEYVLTGEAARKKADEVGKRLAEVTTTTLKVRKEASTESIVLGLVPGGDILSVLEEQEGWVKVSVEEGDGYVSTDYVRLYTENVEAESREEEKARLRKEEEARKAAEEAARRAAEEERRAAEEAAKKAAQKKPQSNSSGSGNTGKPSASHSSNSNSGNSAASSSGQSNSDLGQQIANYALKFLGNPYVYGGTSLTNGADCSGFVQSVYKHFGILLPRTSGEQGASGRAVDGVKNAKPGDLVWYSGHIGIYIGNEQIVHASNSKVGIITSNVYYRDILGIRRII